MALLLLSIVFLALGSLGCMSVFIFDAVIAHIFVRPSRVRYTWEILPSLLAHNGETDEDPSRGYEYPS